MRRAPLAAALAVLVNAPAHAAAPLDLERRVAYQRAVEEVYDRHRVWPAENREPRPPLDVRLPPGAIRRKVLGYLAMSAALQELERPVTAQELQAELARMARDTRDAAFLAELFAALDDDPAVVAECLARPAIVERRLRAWYSGDPRMHAQARVAAECEIARVESPAQMRATSGRYAEVELVRGERALARREERALVVPEARWEALARRLSGTEEAARPSAAALEPAARSRGISRLHEDEEGFHASALLEAGPDRMRVATVTWSKTPFETWWAGELARYTGRLPPTQPAHVYAPLRLAAGACTLDNWTTLPHPPVVPTRREGHSAVWTGTEMIVWGGYVDDVPFLALATGGRYDPATDTWRPTGLGPDVPAGRKRHTAVWTGTEMIVWGGYNEVYLPFNTGGRYDPITDSWRPTALDASTPDRRANHVAVWTGTRMIVWGGGDQYVLGTGGRYDPATDTWSPTSTGSGVPSPRGAPTAVWTGTEMIVWGGAGTGGPLGSGARYDPALDSWTPTSLAGDPPSARYFHAAVWTGREMIVWGGIGDPDLQVGGRYDPSTDTWAATGVSASTPSPRVKATAVWTGAEMIVWGGAAFQPEDDGARYDPANDRWTPTGSGPGLPQGRWWHTAVWTGQEMIVWGGYDEYDDPTRTGGRYLPATDSWAATSLAGLDARERHSAVFTGAEMIVWGGLGDIWYYSDGARLDLATGSWSLTSNSGVPDARSEHTAVWTGTEMVVWGGSGLDGGGRYSPQTDSWLPVSTGSGAPTLRSGHTALWSGSEMIVWGGSDTNTGGRYDPVADAWTPTGTGAGVPEARQWHAAVWTGSEMIVWGGDHGGVELDSGGRYDPLTDAWLPTSGAGAPSARESLTAVWTGTRMIVWGGYGGGRTGGRYDPATDAWTPTAQGINVTAARSGHTAVWTGDEMIVWGGYGGWATGGRYDPAADAWIPLGTGADAPAGLLGHTAIWTGSAMLVWGGFDNITDRVDGAGYGTITITPSGVPAARAWSPYLRTLRTRGGTAPFGFAISGGVLPPGLTLSPAGVISGIPTAPGTRTFTVTVTDANGCKGRRTFELRVRKGSVPPI